MVRFLLILGGIVVANLAWWAWAHRRLGAVKGARRWRLALAVFMGLELVGFAWVIGSRIVNAPLTMSGVALTGIYVWHLLVLPAAIAGAGVVAMGVWIGARVCGGWRGWMADEAVARGIGEEGTVTRREVLMAGVAVAPMVVLPGVTVGTLGRLNNLVVRRIEVAIADLPQGLDGVSIAHISDVHVGQFTGPEKLAAVVERVNELEPDLVVATGDLIDFRLSDLPAALDMLWQLRPRFGMFLCEGNHDLIESRAGFENEVRRVGLPLLLNESRTLSVRGERVQVMGIQWGEPGLRRSPLYDRHFEAVASQRRMDAFPILLSHHPHVFDAAAKAGIPLTLAGHTHGGQLMLNERIGAGPLMFKYYSGLYRRGRSSLVVSNGVGNWFPLRINAPAMVEQVVLRKC